MCDSYLRRQEAPEEVLLPTFYRRISVIVDLPSFHERPIFRKSRFGHPFI